LNKLFVKLTVDCSNQLATSTLVRKITRVGLPLQNSAIFSESERGLNWKHRGELENITISLETS